MPMTRNQYDGEPYFCAACGEPHPTISDEHCPADGPCDLESADVAKQRALRKKTLSSDSSHFLPKE
jgi:hypothetical protein